MLVYVHGNCQAPPLAALLAQARPDWRIFSYECFNTAIIEEIDRYRELVETADILISQPIHDGYRGRDDLSLSYVRANAKPGAPVVTIPSLHFEGQLVGWRSVGFPGYGMDYHDMMLVRLAASALESEAILDRLEDEGLYPDAFIDREIEISLAEARRREDADGVEARAADFLERRVNREPLFHVINHPFRAPLAHVANGALALLGLPPQVAEAGEELLPIPHVPLAPGVARRLGISGGDTYALPGERLPRRDYHRRALAALRAGPRPLLLDALRHPAARDFVARLIETVPGLPTVEV